MGREKTQMLAFNRVSDEQLVGDREHGPRDQADGEGSVEQPSTSAPRTKGLVAVNIQPDDLLELLLLEKFTDQISFAAAEIENALRAAGPQSCHDGTKALVVQAEGLFQRVFGLVGRPLVLIYLLRLLLLHETGDGFTEEAWLELQIAASDLLLRVSRQLALAFGKQFLHLILADPVVLSVVEHWDQDVQVREQVSQRRFLNRDRKVGTPAPFGEPFIERTPSCLHHVSQRLEDIPQEPLAAAHRQHVDAGSEGNCRRHQVGPVLARISTFFSCVYAQRWYAT
jgi:hypothetical protein